MEQDALNVLAGADQVGLIVGTGATVLKLGEGADLDAVGPLRDF
jgi:hypothetical protein